MGKDKRAEKKIKKLSDEDLFSLAQEREAEAARAKIASGNKTKIDQAIIAEMIRRKTKGLTQAKTGMTITLVQQSRVIYNEEGIRLDKKIKDSIKKRIFRRSYVFTLLPEARQKELHKAMVAMLSPAELKAVSVYTLNEEAMSQEVQAERLDVKLIAPYSEIKANAPYLNITPGKAPK